jgi:hypothetical protein
MKPPGKSLVHSLALPCLTAAGLLLGLGAARADYPSTILADNPSAFYRFEELAGTLPPAPNATAPAFDSSVNGNDATYHANNEGDSPLLGVAGLDTNCLAFNGGGWSGDFGYVDIPASEFIEPTPDDVTSAPFSAELWLKVPSQPPTYEVPLEVAQYPNGWNWYVTGADGGVVSYFTLDMRPSLFVSVAPVQFHQWTHLVVTFDGTNAVVYVNGVQTGTYNATGFVPAISYDAHVGSGQGVGWQPFNGNIDEVAFYTNVLTAAQVFTHYTVGTNAIVAPPTPPVDSADPASTTNYAGTPVSFSVSADGTLPLHYQWYENGAPVGPNATTLTFTSQFPKDNNADFQVVITNNYGSVTSAVATLTVLTNVNVPGFPGSIVRNVGSYAAFYVTAFGAQPITYQWTQSSDGGNTFTNLPGQTNATLWLSNVQLTQNGNQYAATVTGPFSSESAGPATLTVQPRTEVVPLTGYGAIVAADSPVAYWRLDEPSGSSTAVDAVGSFDGAYTPNAGTVLYGVPTGIPKTTDPAIGLENGATVQIPFAPELNPVKTWSVESWLQPTSLGANGGDYRVVLSSEYNLYPNPYSGWYIYQQPNNTFAFVPQPANAFVSVGPIAANNWYYLVVTDDGTNFNVYLNGVLATAPYPATGYVANGAGVNQDGTAGITPGLGNTVLGQRTDGAFNTFEGTVDDTAIYNYALSPSQIYSHYIVATKISIATSGTNVVLTWPTGQLQSAPTVAGPYTSVNGATSPYTNSITGTKLFYRVYVP